MDLNSIEPRLLHGGACQASDDAAEYNLFVRSAVNYSHDFSHAGLDRGVHRDIGVTSPELITHKASVPDPDVSVDDDRPVLVLDTPN